MGESSCLRRSLSHPSSAFRHPTEGGPMRCLTESVSFGRFVSESLAWERWSAFSHNRYLEEVQQISKAGSVAEKKAFFEAHYKRRAAMKDAARLEQANEKSVSDPAPDPSGRSCSVSLASSQSVETVDVVFADGVKCVLDIGQSDQVEGHEIGVVGSVSVEPSVSLEDQMQVDNAETGGNPEPGTSDGVKCVLDIGQSDQVGGHEIGVVGSVSVEPSVSLEDQMQVDNAETGGNPEPGTSDGVKCVLDIGQSDQVEGQKSVAVGSVSGEPSVSLEDQMQVDNAEAGGNPEPGTSDGVKCVLDIGQSDQVEGLRSVAVGSVNVEPSVSLEDQMQTEHAESSEMDKVATPKERTAHEDSGKKESVALRASKRLMSTDRAPKLPRASVKQETFSSTKTGSPSGGSTYAGFISKKNSGSKALHMSISFSSCSAEKIIISPRNSTGNKSILGRNITSASLKTVAEDCARSSISNGSKSKPPTVSSPFRFRSEERAAKRREARKLEERCSASEAENIHQEGKQRCKTTKTQQSTNSGSRLDKVVGRESKSRTQTTRMSVVTLQPPKSGRKPPSSESAHERRFIPPQQTLHSAALPKRKLISLSVTSSPQRKRGQENAPPNT